jgi:hypothetical protein
MLSLLVGLAAAYSACTTDVTVTPTDAGLRAAYRLCAPTTGFSLNGWDASQRTDAWSAREGWVFDGTTIHRQDGRAFRNFALELQSDRHFYDRRYVAVEAVGHGGWVVYLPAFAAAHGATRVRFARFPNGSAVRFASATSPAPSAWLPVSDEEGGHKVVYVGPASYITTGRVVLIAGEETPPWLRARLLEEIAHVTSRLTARFGRAPTRDMTLIVTSVEDRPTREYKGGVVGEDVIVAELRGIDLSSPDESVADSITNLAAHEAAHLWNAGLWRGTTVEEQPWLHEGSAEYLASRLWENADAMRTEAAQRLNACFKRRDPHPLDGSQGAVTGSAPYDCGFMIQLAAEAGSLRAGRGDAFTLWRAVFEHNGDDTYSADVFLAEARSRGGDAAAEAIQTLMSGPSDPLWAALPQQLAALGISAQLRQANATEGELVRRIAIQGVLGSLCNGGHGFYGGMVDHIKLDTGDRCGAALAGDPDVSGVNGVNIMTSPLEAYATIREVCSRSSDLRFDQPNGGRLPPVRCAAVIPDLPHVFEITALPDLPQP